MKTIQVLSLCTIIVCIETTIQSSQSSEQKNECQRRITFNESSNIELQYDLGADYYQAQKDNLKRLAINMRENPWQNFQDLSPEETTTLNKELKKRALVSKMTKEEKVIHTKQKIRYKLLSKKYKKNIINVDEKTTDDTK